MFYKDKLKLIRDHQIDELLLTAHLEQESGFDLIEEYFQFQSSLDCITKRAQELIQEQNDPEVRDSIAKNLSECIVVKNQYELHSFFGFAKKIFGKLGMNLGKSREIRRAEKLIEQILNHTPQSSGQ